MQRHTPKSTRTDTHFPYPTLFRATDILAAADDDVRLAVDDEQILGGVEIAEVAGAEIAIGEKGGLGRLRVVPIAVEIADGPDAHLARLALRQRLAGLVENRQIDQRLRRRPGRHRQIGRASCRERVCQYVEISGVAVSLKKKRKNK